MYLGDLLASSKRPQSQTLSEWAEYHCSLLLERFGLKAFAAVNEKEKIIEGEIFN
jgi:hypothetical protein